MFSKMILFFLLSLATLALAAPSPSLVKRASPSVSFSYATVVGTSSGGVDSFKGIPFAQPPTGSLRLKPPQPITSNLGTIQSQADPTSCPQFLTPSDGIPQGILGYIENTPFFQAATNAGEDCLTLNVQRPSMSNNSTKLPVLFWIYGGGFELGSDGIYDGTNLVTKSVADGNPILFVEVNYRLGGFGFMPGKELQDEGSSNLGLLDQRLGLQWVAENIEAFGGDPDKVTIWGESAGSISVLDQMILYNGDNTYKGKSLFRGAIMNSGSVVPTNPVDTPKAQAVFDQVVQAAGCSNSSDTLACLRALPYEQFLDAANSVPGIFNYQSLMLSYLPRPDGTVLTDSPDALVLSGQYAKVPFIIGDQNDEGTLFALVQENLTTTQDVVDYFKSLYFLDATEEQVEQLVATYPDDPTQGSPYGTGELYNIYPQYKRLASILGDLVFNLARRAVLSGVGSTVPTWSYLATYGSGTPVLGTNHGSDVIYDFDTVPSFISTSITTYYINFVNNLDPNNGSNATGLINWPNWNDGNQLLDFGQTSNTLTPDDYREDSYNFLEANLQSLRV